MERFENEQLLDDALADLYGETPSLRFEKNWREAVRREEQVQMKNRKNIWLKTVLPIAAALVLILGANWAGDMIDDYPSEASRQESRNAKLMSGSTSSSGSSVAAGYGAVNYAMEESYETEAAYDTAAFTTAARDMGAAEEAPVPEPQQERKLIRTVDISLRTETFESDVAGIQQLLNEYGGYIENMYQQGEAGSVYGRSASLTMRVPSDKLDAFLDGISGYGRVTSRSETTEDMTEQYADNEVRIQTLETKMERLQTLLSQAEQVSDILEIESEIADTQYQLERYETRQLNIDRRVDMSYVYVNVTETIPQDAADDDDLTLGQRLKAALKASIEGLGRFGRNLLVFLVMALPVLVPVGIAVLVIWLVKRKAKARRSSAEPADDDTAE